MIESVEEGYKIYLIECSRRKVWLEEYQYTWYKKLLFFLLQLQINDSRWISQLTAMEKVLKLSEKEKKIFN